MEKRRSAGWQRSPVVLRIDCGWTSGATQMGTPKRSARLSTLPKAEQNGRPDDRTHDQGEGISHGSLICGVRAASVAIAIRHHRHDR